MKAPPALPPEALAAIGRGLYGARWQSAMARDLQISRPVLVRWARGSRQPSRISRAAVRLLERTYALQAEVVALRRRLAAGKADARQ